MQMQVTYLIRFIILATLSFLEKTFILVPQTSGDRPHALAPFLVIVLLQARVSSYTRSWSGHLLLYHRFPLFELKSYDFHEPYAPAR